MASSSDRQIKNVGATSSIQPGDITMAVKQQCWRYIPLVKAILRGDWDRIRRFFDQDRAALTARITEHLETALHIAVGTGGRAIHVVEKLVELMPPEALAVTDINLQTALHIAAWVGNTRAAMVLQQKHRPLLYIRGFRDLLPIHVAALNARRETLSYLLAVTEDDPVSLPFSNQSGVELILFVISSNFFDIALNLVERYPHLATIRTPAGGCALERIATKESAFPSGCDLNFWQRTIYSYLPVKLGNYSKDQNTGDVENPHISKVPPNVHKDNWAQSFGENSSTSDLSRIPWKFLELSVPQIKHIRQQKLIHLQAIQLVRSLCQKITISHDINAYHTLVPAGMLAAVRTGIPEVIEEIVDWFPSLIWTRDSERHNLFQEAIIHRHESVFNLIYQMSDHKHIATTFLHESGDTMLHLAGRIAPPDKLNLVPGAALQMQREIQWFQEVKKFVTPSLVEWHNASGETPAMVFTREHKNLVVEGEKWMKDTSTSCTIAAALIATVVFAAAITVPGGNDNVTGLPIFSHKKAFVWFAIFDAVSLFTSTTSLLMFLSILTSRYAEGDFLSLLPKRLIIGLVTLFLSITTMIVAFSSTLYLVFGHNKAWILIPVVALACLPITSFVSLQFPLLVDLISSTYGPGIFGKRSNRLLY